MSSNDRRARARRRAWGRGPTILRFEPLEGRQLLSISDPIAAIASAAGAETSSATTTSIAEMTTQSTTTSAEATTLASQSDTSTVLTTTAPTSATTTAAAATYDGSNLVASAFDTLHNMDWGDAFHAVGTVRNLGSTSTPVAYDVNVFASTKPTLTSDAIFVGQVVIPAGVPASGKTDFDAVLNAPRVPLPKLGTAPSYYLIPSLVPESGKAPAATAGLPLNSVVTITPKIPPKLVGAGLSISPGTVAWGGTINVTANVKNDSQGVAPPTNARIVLTPVGKTPGGGSDYQIGQVPIPAIGSFQTVTASQTILLPTFAPTILSTTSQYTVTMIQDADATANPLLTPKLSTSANDTTKLTILTPANPAPTTSKPPAADLTVVNVQEPSPTMFRGATFPVGATVRNAGPGDAGPFKVRFLLLTDESANAPALVLGDASLPGLAAGTEQDVLQTVTLPYRTPDGFAATNATGRIVVQVDPDRSIDQTNTTNDTLAAPAVQLKVLSPDGQTTVPILPGSTTTSTTANGSTSTTPATPAGTASNFETTTVAADAVPVVTATTTTTTTKTPKPLSPKAAAHQAALVAKQKAAAAKHAAAVARVKARQAARQAAHAQKAHTLRVYQPGSNI